MKASDPANSDEVDEDLVKLMQSSVLLQTTVHTSEELEVDECINRPIVQNNKSNFLLLKLGDSDLAVNSKIMGHGHFVNFRL